MVSCERFYVYIVQVSTGLFLNTFSTYRTDYQIPVAAVWNPLGDNVAVAIPANNRSDLTNILDIYDISTVSTNRMYATAHSLDLTDARLSPDETKIVTASADSTLNILDAHTGEILVKNMVYSTSYMRTLSGMWSPDGQIIVAGGQGGLLSFYNSTTGAGLPAQSLQTENKDCRVNYSPDGTYMSIDGAGGMYLYNVTQDFFLSVKLWSIFDPLVPIDETWTYYTAWHPNSSALAVVHALPGNNVSSLQVRDVKSGAVLVGPRHVQDLYVACVTWSPDGMYIATGGYDNQAMVWSATSLAHVSTFDKSTTAIKTMAFSPDSHVLAFDVTTSINIWDFKNNVLVRTLIGNSNEMISLYWNRAGDSIVTSSIDKTVRLWNALNGFINVDIALNPIVGEDMQVTILGYRLDPSLNRIQLRQLVVEADSNCFEFDKSTELHVNNDGTQLTLNSAWPLPGSFNIYLMNHVLLAPDNSMWQELTVSEIVVNCPAGQEVVSLHTVDAACKPCTGAYYSPTSGMPCVMCFEEVNSDRTTCTNCPAGTQSNLNGTCSSCEAVGPQYYSAVAGSACIFCPDAVDSNRTSCSQCPAGSQSDLKGGCVACSEVGSQYYSPDGQTCLACFDSVDANHTECTPCPTGTQGMGGVCESCMAGTYAPQPGMSCLTCLGGTVNEDRTSCIPCEPGHYFNTSIRSCETCLPGSFNSVTGQFVCEACATGHHQAASGATHCLQCTPGRALSEIGSSRNECVECTTGTMTALSGQATCQECPSSMDFQAASGQQACMSCPEHSVATSNHSACACLADFFAIPFSDPLLFKELDPEAYKLYMRTYGDQSQVDNNPNQILGLFCAQCPVGADCQSLGTSIESVTAEAGYFQGIDGTGTMFLPCFNPDACGQFGVCTEGYTGVSCAECVEDEAVLNRMFICQTCPSTWMTVLVIASVLLLLMVYLAVKVQGKRKGKAPSSLSVLYKILMSTMQVLTIYIY